MEKYSMFYPGTEEMTRTVKVEVLKNYKLRLFFSNGEIKIYDVKPLVEKGGKITEPLKQFENFATVKIKNRRILWNFTGKPINDIDICSELLYWDSTSA